MMPPTPRRKLLTGWELVALAMLAWLIVFGVAARGGSWLATAAAFAFIGAALLIARLWQSTVRQAEAARPLTSGGRVWNAAVFVAWLVAMVVVAWRWGM
jgi:hypothetical protein